MDKTIEGKKNTDYEVRGASESAPIKKGVFPNPLKDIKINEDLLKQFSMEIGGRGRCITSVPVDPEWRISLDGEGRVTISGEASPLVSVSNPSPSQIIKLVRVLCEEDFFALEGDYYPESLVHSNSRIYNLYLRLSMAGSSKEVRSYGLPSAWKWEGRKKLIMLKGDTEGAQRLVRVWEIVKKVLDANFPSVVPDFFMLDKLRKLKRLREQESLGYLSSGVPPGILEHFRKLEKERLFGRWKKWWQFWK